MDVTWTDRVEAVTFNNIRLGQAFFVDYDNGERCLYMRITEMADLQDPAFTYNAVDLQTGLEFCFELAEKVIPCQVRLSVIL